MFSCVPSSGEARAVSGLASSTCSAADTNGWCWLSSQLGKQSPGRPGLGTLASWLLEGGVSSVTPGGTE